MTTYAIELNQDGDVCFIGEIPTMLKLFLEDLDLHGCEEVLYALAEIRAGTKERFSCGTNATWLLATSAGASLRIAANLTRNPAFLLSLDELDDGVNLLRKAYQGAQKSRAG